MQWLCPIYVDNIILNVVIGTFYTNNNLSTIYFMGLKAEVLWGRQAVDMWKKREWQGMDGMTHQAHASVGLVRGGVSQSLPGSRMRTVARSERSGLWPQRTQRRVRSPATAASHPGQTG